MKIFKKLASVAFLAIGLCVVGWSEPTPEQVAERTSLLFKAIGSNNVEQAKLCIKTGADINGKREYRNNKYITPLLYAVQENRIEIVKLLINAKVDMNASIPEFRHTPITLAAQSGYTDIVNLLIKSGLDVNAKNYNGETAIMHVYDKNNMAELLIKLGADVNAKSKSGKTPLMSVRSGTVAEMLIKAGADVNAKDNGGKTALMFASMRGDNDIVYFLIKAGADVNAKANNGSTALYFANYKSKDRFLEPKEGIIAQLLAAGAKE